MPASTVEVLYSLHSGMVGLGSVEAAKKGCWPEVALEQVDQSRLHLFFCLKAVEVGEVRGGVTRALRCGCREG